MVTNSSPNVRGSTKRSWPPWVKVITTWVCLASGVLGALGPQQLAAHAQVDDEDVAAVEAEEQVLAPPVDAGDLAALEPGRRTASCWGGGGSSACPVTSTVLIRLPTTSRVEVAAEGLDFGELRHQVVVLPLGLHGRVGRACSACQASRAAACSACFFDRPSPAPRALAADVRRWRRSAWRGRGPSSATS